MAALPVETSETERAAGTGRGGSWPIRSVAICGVGAVGSEYADLLHHLDPALVSVVARGERRERLRRDGLTVNGRHFGVRCVGPDDAASGAPDLLLVAVKHHHLAQAVEDLRGVVGPDTI